MESIMGGHPHEHPPSEPYGILQTKDYEHFMILRDTGELLLEFVGAKKANRCLPGDHVRWKGEQCELELRDAAPWLVGTLELTSKSTYGMTKRGHLMYLCVPYDKRYPPFIVGSSEKDRTQNRIVLMAFESWTGTFPRGSIQQTLGPSGDRAAEREALIWQACPWRYPVYAYQPTVHSTVQRTPLVGHTFHIDPEGCRDVDDVVTLEEQTGGAWKVTITISDVAAFVEDGDPIDIQASLIGQTLYDKDGRVLRPMLPPAYSEQACSLLPGKVSYGISFQFMWDGHTIHSPHWFSSTLEVHQSYTYEAFQASNSPHVSLLRDIASYLAKKPLEDAHEWIEQLMLFYNTEAGGMLKAIGQGILRRHSAPHRERLERYRQYVPSLERLAYSSAEYCLADERDTRHEGLNTDAYAHASSPIRRYADLVNQRVLSRWIQGHTENIERYIVPQAMYDMNQRGKAIKRFARDMDFLNAIQEDHRIAEEVILMEILPKSDGWVKLKLYVPSWSRMISTTYRRSTDHTVWSRDETVELPLECYRTYRIRFALHPQGRNWKERAVIHLME